MESDTHSDTKHDFALESVTCDLGEESQADSAATVTSKSPTLHSSFETSTQPSLTSFPSLSPSVANSPEQVKTNGSSQPLDHTDEFTSPARVTPHARQDLFAPAQEDFDRSTLFYDAPREVRAVPGTLHLQSDQNLSHLIRRTGAVKLVKQLSSDLAQRDAHVTLVQRKAEERERLLRKMLRECEISNLDIESRLRESDKTGSQRSRTASIAGSERVNEDDLGGVRSDASIDERLDEAVVDEINTGPDYGGFLSQADRYPTARPLRKNSSQTADQPGGLGRGNGSTKGWKALFRGGNTTVLRSSGLRKGASTSQLRPSYNVSVEGRPIGPTTRTPSSTIINRDRNVSAATSSSSASGNSMATWALRMVAGNAQSDNSEGKTNSTDASAARRRDSDAGPASKVLKAGAKSTEPTNLKLPRGSIASHGANSTVRRTTAETASQTTAGSASIHSDQAAVDGEPTNLGPVEMDTILPENTRPPTVAQTSFSAEFLTDNFGFIYDQRRKRKVNETASGMARDKRGSQVESLKNHRRISNYADTVSEATRRASQHGHSNSAENKSSSVPTKKWQDFLRFTNLKTELLSHTPSPAPITDITTNDANAEANPTQVVISTSEQGSLPALSKPPEPSASRVTSEYAEIVSLSQPTSPGLTNHSETDPVKALVEHLAEVHENVQREKTLKWNDFLRKVRADRRRDISAKGEVDSRRPSQTPETLLTDGELIGAAGLGVSGKVGRAKGSEFRNLVLAGVPTAYRAKIWAECSGAVSLRVPGYYEELTSSPFTDDTIVQQIQMDIPRTLTDNIYYRRGAGIDKLKEVLLAYARRNPDIGYCQGMNLIAANLLLIMPTAEDAFWVLTSMIENILPDGYYSPSLLTSRADQVVLRRYVTDILPHLSAHLNRLGIELEALTFQWFLSVFTDCLSAEALFRVWDVVLCLPDTPANVAPKQNQTVPQGAATFLFQVALALLKLNEKDLKTCENPAEVYRYINRGMTDHAISIDNLIRASEGLRKEVKMAEVLERRREAVEEELEVMRKRETIRKGKGRALDEPTLNTRSESKPSISQRNGPEMLRPPRRKLKRQPGRKELDEDLEIEASQFGDLQVRTPMPIDEEVEWRA